MYVTLFSIYIFRYVGGIASGVHGKTYIIVTSLNVTEVAVICLGSLSSNV